MTRRSSRSQPVRAVAARVLAQVLHDGASLAVALPAGRQDVAETDSGLLAELCYGCLRHGHALQGLISLLVAKPLPTREGAVQALLMVGLYQLRHMRVAPHTAVHLTVEATRALDKPWASRLVNGVLRQYQRQATDLEARLQAKPETRHSHPSWLIEALQQAWPGQAEDVLAANNNQAGMTLRVNRQQTTREAYQQCLASQGIDAMPCEEAEAGLYLAKALPVEALPGFATGACSVQDEAAQLCAPLLELAPGQRVLDACAAPGGKTGHILEQVPGLAELVAVDQDAARLARVQDNLARLRLQAQLVCADAARPTQWHTGRPYDRILLDAPCSGTGVIRRHPDIKFLRRPTDIPALASRQRELLDALWPLLAPGGVLLYTTCSVLPAENESVVAAFLAATPDAEPLPIEARWGMETACGRQWLPEQTGPAGHDGFYYARLRKRTPA